MNDSGALAPVEDGRADAPSDPVVTVVDRTSLLRRRGGLAMLALAGFCAGGAFSHSVVALALQQLPAAAPGAAEPVAEEWAFVPDPGAPPLAVTERSAPPGSPAESTAMAREPAPDSVESERDEEPGRRPSRRARSTDEPSDNADDGSTAALPPQTPTDDEPTFEEEEEPHPHDPSLSARVRREVRRDDDGVWHVPRGLAEEVVSNRSVRRGLVSRVAPWEGEDGEQGLLLEGVGGLLGRVGIRSNDVLLQANGIQLNSPQRGAGAFRTLRESGTLSLLVLRAGRRISLRYVFE
jgi:hypothetical protein